MKKVCIFLILYVLFNQPAIRIDRIGLRLLEIAQFRKFMMRIHMQDFFIGLDALKTA